ncbi:MAG: hypothetical protein L3J03_06305 [Desulfobacterales bacterium]|nr:hypothetical protein [Desulfobacterales bacterium]
MCALNSDKLIIELNYANQFINERRTGPEALDSHRMFELLSETVVDKRTLEVVEIHDLYQALNHTRTHVGAAHLFHSLNTPAESLELIHAKQEGLMELEAHDRLRSAVEEFLGTFGKGEPALFQFLNAHYQPMVPYGALKRAIKAAETMHRAAAAIPRPDTIYLDSLLRQIASFGESPVSELVRKPTYRTIRGVVSRREKGFFTPALRFRPGRISGGSVGPAIPSILAVGAGWTGLLKPMMAESLALLTGGGIVIGMLYGAVVKPIFDQDTALLPLRKRFLQSNRFGSAMEAVAGLDEIISFSEFRRNIPHPTVIPEFTDIERHYFIATGMKNPVLAKNDPDYVGSDVSIDGQGVTFITGPNSGGKTTYCKGVIQNQILGQIGAPVVATRARMNIADHIAYQAPAFDGLNDPEGRFGTELQTTRDIFFKISPKSLVVLDEIAEGTTSHERMDQSVAVLDGLFAKNNSTLLVTHSYELAEMFMASDQGRFIQVEFKGNRPTHRMIPGISRASHARRVAKKIGFSAADIQRHLREEGYL